MSGKEIRGMPIKAEKTMWSLRDELASTAARTVRPQGELQ
jgi:hypothetical protein